MIRVRLVLVPLLLCVACATCGAAAAPAPRSRPARSVLAPRARAAGDSTTRPRSRVAPRMLDDIHIEGEIPVPQVLFITARDQRRFMEFQHHRYQRSSLELGRATTTPSRIVVTAPVPGERKENQR